MNQKPFILLINPWITDFAAYDLWSKPLGLLQVGALLRQGGCRVGFLDCLDRFDPDTNERSGEVLPPTFQRFGTGKYPKVPIQTPGPLEGIPRRYYRYGIHPDSLRRQLDQRSRPDLVMITCGMTYWYPGLRDTIQVVRERLPGVPIWLGGVYARLCSEHARRSSGADRVITGPLQEIPGLLGFDLKNQSSWSGLPQAPSPALDLVTRLVYLPLLTSLGCPMRCPYCASAILNPVRELRPVDSVFGDIRHYAEEHGIEDFAFYDDALLVDAENHLLPLLERVCQAGIRVRFHTPNALHVRHLTLRVCQALFQAGFTTLRLGLETTRADRQRDWGGKADSGQFLEAIENLKAAGFSRDQIGVYLLCGLPEQSPGEVAESIQAVSRSGVQPHLSEFSPIPGTASFNHLPAGLRRRVEEEPLLSNNSYFACRRPGFSYDDLVQLKKMTRLERRVQHVI